MGKDFSRKTIGTRMKRPSPLPKNYYEWQRPPDILFSRKFDGFKKCYCKLKQRIMGEMGGVVDTYVWKISDFDWSSTKQ